VGNPLLMQLPHHPWRKENEGLDTIAIDPFLLVEVMRTNRAQHGSQSLRNLQHLSLESGLVFFRIPAPIDFNHVILGLGVEKKLAGSSEAHGASRFSHHGLVSSCDGQRNKNGGASASERETPNSLRNITASPPQHAAHDFK
jgi:hypothetical protein